MLITAFTQRCFPASTWAAAHMTHWTVTGKLCKWRCQRQDMTPAKDRPLSLWSRSLLSQNPFFRNTLVYKRLTEPIFDPPGRRGRRGVLNMCCSWKVHDWPLWLKRGGGGQLWEPWQIADSLMKQPKHLRRFWRREGDDTQHLPSQTH